MGTVDEYLTDLDPVSRGAVERLYAIARDIVPDAEQGLGYGMPALVYRGKPLLSVMRAKGHIGVYPFSPDAVTAAAELLPGFDVAKGTIRFQPEHPLPDEAVRVLVARRKEQIEGA
ncbi:hypothetical protein ASD65_07450 [Microbacterium sp. Root61]|uniref:iron chaperone n=1 Tax=Microbacterium sp. Root61 TaxID=1736570 RepID=UPI0006FF5417|nr:DUF1801 domain-containing protein [Microbacterium sp. Root61]KRA24275.1 hypothetical protein ASD65_07450 [Microbacterium sp. Root61]